MNICTKLRTLCSQFYNKIFITKFKICVLGLKGSSKSSIINSVFRDAKIKQSKGVNTLEYLYNGVTYSVYDVKGDHKYRKLWDCLYRKCDVLIYCVDLSEKKEEWDKSKFELKQLLHRNSRKMKNMLVLGTKNDKGRAMDINDMIYHLGLKSYIDIEIACFSVSAKEKTNIELVQPWLYEQYQIKHKKERLNIF